MNVGLDHGGVDPHAPAGRHPVLAGEMHNPLMDLLHHLRPERHAPTRHGLGVGRLGSPDAGEIAVYQIGAHLPLHNLVTPVAHVDAAPAREDGFYPTANCGDALTRAQISYCQNPCCRAPRIVDAPSSSKIATQAAPAHQEVLVPVALLLSLSRRSPPRLAKARGLVFRL